MKQPISGVAIEKATARDGEGYMDGNDLLSDLRGDNGTTMRSVAIGYVMAVHDAAAAGDLARPRLTLEDAVATVEGWLQANAPLRQQAAAELVRAALDQASVPAAAPATSGPQRLFSRARRRWAGLAGTTALCVAAALAGWTLSGIAHASRSAVELGRSAASIARLVLEERRYEKDMFINIEDRDRLDEYARKWTEARDALSGVLASAEQLDLSDRDRAALRAIASDFRDYVDGYERVLTMIRRGEIRTTQEANDEFARYKAAAHRIEASSAAIYERAARSGSRSPTT